MRILIAICAGVGAIVISIALILAALVALYAFVDWWEEIWGDGDENDL